MRFRFTITGLFCLILVAGVLSMWLAPKSPGIQITLVDFDKLWEYDGLWDEMPLADLYDNNALVASDADIKSYDWSKHTVKISADALDRIPRRGEFHVSSQYFLLVVNCKPCYLGSIETAMSSDGKKMPTILVDDLPARGKNQSIEITINKCFPTNLFSIQKSDDKRYNERLKHFLEHTGRLKNGE